MDHVITSEDDQDLEGATDEEALVMAEKLNDSRALLAGFLKLTMFNVLEPKMAAPIWGHFISVSYDYTRSIITGMGTPGIQVVI